MSNIKFDYVNSKCHFETLQIFVWKESKWEGPPELHADDTGPELLRLDKQIMQ